MSRAHRRMQNAASLINPVRLVKTCQHVLVEMQERNVTCGAYAIACYSFELEHVADYCKQHAFGHGFCSQCGNELTTREKEFTNRLLCDACLGRAKRQEQLRGAGAYDLDDDDELDDWYGDEGDDE